MAHLPVEVTATISDAALADIRDRGVDLDAWGRPMLFEVQVESRKIRVWSTGRNGVDEKGLGDDILVEKQIPD
jgi:hypothetical protein